MITGHYAISEFAVTGSGGTPSRSNKDFFAGGTIPWIKSGELHTEVVTTAEERITEHALRTSSAKLLEPGVVLIAMYGATVGACSLLGIQAATNQAVCFIEPDKTRCSGPFLRYALIRSRPVLLAQRTGAAQPNISQKIIREHKIWLPRLTEQNRLVAILDEADSLRRTRREADDIANRLASVLFENAVANTPTRSQKLGRVFPVIQTGWSPVCQQRPASGSEWAVLKLGSVTWCDYDPMQNKALLPDVSPRTELEVLQGDLLFVRKNTYDLVGAAAYVWETPPRRIFSDLIFRLRCDPELGDPCFLWQALLQPAKRREIQSNASGAAGSMPNISQGRLKEVSLDLPSLPVQLKFRAKLQELHQASQQRKITAATLDTLFQTLLERAFDGRLSASNREGLAKETVQEMAIQKKKR